MPLSFAEIVNTYAKRTAWSPACCGVTLTDGTRVVPSACGTGIRINGRYVAFTDAPAIDWSKKYPV